MDLHELIRGLLDPAAYPHPVAAVELRQTHISLVFLAGPFAYKVKKPIDAGFLNYRTLAARRHFCEEEVRLNRRLAPSVYRGVVPITRGHGGLRVGGPGHAIEWAVQMERLPDDATLRSRLSRGEVDPEWMRELARRLARFHATAPSGPAIAAFGRFEVVARNARENFDQTASHVGRTVSAAVFARVGALTETALARHRPLLEARAAAGVPRDGHGDLRLEHVYVFADRPPPDDLVIVDCIEFNERFRLADPVADIAFLVMDLAYHGQRGLAGTLAEAYFSATGDWEGAALLPFYTAYRAVVRAKVGGMKACAGEVPEAERELARERAVGYWLLALGELATRSERPALVLVGGLPGAGKSTLGRELAARAGFQVIRSDLVRKELAGTDTAEPVRVDAGIYAEAWTERTYAECRRRAEAILFDGGRALVDASFGVERRRRAFLDLAARFRVPALFLHCQVDPEMARARLAARIGDASDADWSIHKLLAQRWEPFGPATAPQVVSLHTTGSLEETLATAWDALRRQGLQDDGR
jgi:aminoglycoside phosphotransferase family enzyme/predicted kinase